MKRIGLYLGFPPEGGGAFQYAQSVLAGLASLHSYETVVVYSHPAWATKLEPYANRIEITELCDGKLEWLIRSALRFGLPLSPWIKLARHVHPFTRRLLELGCDLWVFPAQDVWTYAVPAPALGVIHDLMHRYAPHFPEVSAFGLYSRRERHYRRLCGGVRGVLVDSEVGKLQVAESYGMHADRIHVLPYIAPSYMNSRDPVDFDDRYQLPPKFVFYPAQFWEHKNHRRLLQALAAIQNDAPDLHLVLAGSKKNAYRGVMQVIEQFQLQDKVIMLGYIPDEDIPSFYRRARALVMPTFFGPTNIPPLEAMAAGCPMAVSDIYAMPEQVGDAAMLFDPSSVGEISRVLLRLARDDDLCRKLAEAGKARAERWGQKQFNERLNEIIDAVIGA